MRRFIIERFEPAYLRESVRGSLPERARAAVQRLKACDLCPRACGVDRSSDAPGRCRTGRFARVASAFAHPGEEACLSGNRGSGTIFFGGCNLGCLFCQNAELSHGDEGRECSPHEIASLMLDLQDRGCHNINFVTPSHVIPQIIEAVALAVGRGLRLPIVYNTGGYDTVDSLRLLEGVVDIYMPDFKLWSAEACEQHLTAGDYGRQARAAIAEMHRQVGELVFRPDGTACRGLLVRHLVMPGLLDESAAIFEWLARLSPDTFVNIMGQYHPWGPILAAPPPGDPLQRRPTAAELESARLRARQAGLWRFE